jgi:hypothetical protein
MVATFTLARGTPIPSKSAQSLRKIWVMFGLRVAGRCLSEWSGGWLVAGSFDSQASFVKYWAVGIVSFDRMPTPALNCRTGHSGDEDRVGSQESAGWNQGMEKLFTGLFTPSLLPVP